MIRNVLFWVLLIISTIIIWLCALIFYLVPGKLGQKIAHFFQTVWAKMFLVLSKYVVGLSVSVTGLENIPKVPVIFACRHESAWETMAFLALLPPCSVVLKQELKWIPIYGWHALRVGMIPIQRSGGGAALKNMLRKAANAQLMGRRHILIFPEGTRAKPQQQLPLHSGLTALQKNLKCPIIPVSHNAGSFWPKKSLCLKPGVITVKIHPAIAPNTNKQTLNAQVLSYYHAVS